MESGEKNQTEEIYQCDMDLFKVIIPLINQQRFLREHFWLDIGKALYMADKGGNNGLLSWTCLTEDVLGRFKNLPKFMGMGNTVPDICRNLYHTFANSSITMKTLAWYAREDHPDKYTNWNDDWCMSSVEYALNTKHTIVDIVIALYRVYCLDFIYCSISNKWFQFRNYRWHEDHQGINLRKIISKDFIKRFETLRTNLSRQAHETTDRSVKCNIECTIKKITVLIGKFKTVAFKNNIMQEARKYFDNDRFVSLLDCNSKLTSVTNGVLEVSGINVIFRNAKPEDYVSRCTNIPYHSDYNWEHPLVKECMKLFGQMFITETSIHNFLKFSASYLEHQNNDKKIRIFSCENSNIKSMVIKLLEATFGSYHLNVSSHVYHLMHDKSNPNIIFDNITFERRVRMLGPAFLWIMIQCYPHHDDVELLTFVPGPYL